MNSDKLLVAKLTSSKIIALIIIAFGAVCGFLSRQAGENAVSVIFFAIIGLGIFILIVVGSLEMNDKFILYKCLWANYKIMWNEVEKIEMDAQGNAIIFVGDNKKLAVIGPAFWSNKVRWKMLELINLKASENQIGLQENHLAGFTMSKNTKVR